MFGCSELGMRLEDVYDMSWAEFCIKSFGYKRMMENELRQTRKIAYWAAIGSHLDPKKLPKNEIKFMKIGDEVVIAGATDEQKAAFKEEYKQYLKEREAVLAQRAEESRLSQIAQEAIKANERLKQELRNGFRSNHISKHR